MGDKIFNRIILKYSDLKFIKREQLYVIFKCKNDNCDLNIHIYNDKRGHCGICGSCISFKKQSENNDIFDRVLSPCGQKVTRHKCKLCNGPRTRSSKTGICLKCLKPKPYVRAYKKIMESIGSKEISISLEEYSALMDVNKNCHYCDDKLNIDKFHGKRHCLDRKDNSLGYHINNVVPCCFKCNWVKGSKLTYNEMLILGAVRKNDLQRIIDAVNKTLCLETIISNDKKICIKNNLKSICQ